MNLHEYQAKELLKKYNVPVQEGIPVDTANAAEEAYKQIKVNTGNSFAVVKAQIHAGGRGKGKIKGTEQRGVAVAKNAEDVRNFASNMLGGTLVTIQTGEAGQSRSQNPCGSGCLLPWRQSGQRILSVDFIGSCKRSECIYV